MRNHTQTVSKLSTKKRDGDVPFSRDLPWKRNEDLSHLFIGMVHQQLVVAVGCLLMIRVICLNYKKIVDK
jgi:hypothetical protein